jgi:LysM repeat protein
MFKRLGLGVLIALVLSTLVGAQAVWAAPNESGPVHIVRYGETLSGIAARYGVNMWAIARANCIANPSRIYAGQRLIIPAGGRPAPIPWGGRVHIVRYGETLSGIAFRYGVSMWAIVRANGIANPSFIYAGQRLVLPSL